MGLCTLDIRRWDLKKTLDPGRGVTNIQDPTTPTFPGLCISGEEPLILGSHTGYVGLTSTQMDTLQTSKGRRLQIACLFQSHY